MALIGEFTYNNTLLAPLWYIIIAGENASHQSSQVLYRTKVQYISPAMEYYYCVEVYISKTNSTSIIDTFKWSNTNLFKQIKITFKE